MRVVSVYDVPATVCVILKNKVNSCPSIRMSSIIFQFRFDPDLAPLRSDAIANSSTSTTL
jgi:hypothetical protein